MSRRTESDLRALVAFFMLVGLGFGLGWAARR